MAEEVLSGIRTVFAFGGEQLEIERYNKQLTKERRAVLMKGVISGIGDGIMRFLFFGSNALGFWYGVKLVLEDRDRIDKQYTPEILMIVCFRAVYKADEEMDFQRTKLLNFGFCFLFPRRHLSVCSLLLKIFQEQVRS